jgi:hypothetical protein
MLECPSRSYSLRVGCSQVTPVKAQPTTTGSCYTPRMKFLAMGVLLAVMQAVVPTPGRAQIHAADTTNKKQERPKSSAEPSSQPKAVPIPSGGEPRTDGKREDTKEADETPVCIAFWNWIKAILKRDWIPFFTLLLVVTAVLQVCLLWRQSKIMVAQERAYLAVGMEQPPLSTKTNLVVKFTVTNVGRTPALHAKVKVWVEVVDAPFNDFTDTATVRDDYEPTTFYPNPPNLNRFSIDLKRSLSETEIAAINALTKLLCVRVLVRYTDAFGNHRYGNFGHYLTSVGAAFLPKYNDSD